MAHHIKDIPKTLGLSCCFLSIRWSTYLILEQLGFKESRNINKTRKNSSLETKYLLNQKSLRSCGRQWRCKDWRYPITLHHSHLGGRTAVPAPREVALVALGTCILFRRSCLKVQWTCTECQLHWNLPSFSGKEESLTTKLLRPSRGWMKSWLKSMGRLLLASLRGGLHPNFKPLKQMQSLFSFVLLNIALFSKQRPQTVMCLFLWSSPLMKSFQLFYQ